MTEFDYYIFGLMLRFNRSIPAFVPSARHDAPDVRIHLLEDPSDHPWPVDDSSWQMEAPPVFIWKAVTPCGVYLKLRYASDDGQAEFVLDPAGTELWVTWRGRATLVDVTTLLFGAIFGCLLRHRGLTCLHGSVVGIEGQAIALLGAKGAGKSTMAMGLLQRGATVIADDLAVLERHGSRFGVRAGPPRLRLGPESASFLGSYEDLEPLWSQTAQRPQKRALNTMSDPASAPSPVTPLVAVYVLEPRDASGDALSITSPAKAEALAKVMAYRYTAFALDRSGHARDFAMISGLVASTRVREIHRPNELGSVPELADRILRDVAALLVPVRGA